MGIEISEDEEMEAEALGLSDYIETDEICFLCGKSLNEKSDDLCDYNHRAYQEFLKSKGKGI